MKQIYIFDTTLRDGEQSPGCSMNLNEKIEVTKKLEQLKVDVIEAGFAVASPGDFEAVKTVAGIVKDCTVASLSRATKKDIDASYEALKGAVSPRIHTFLATSKLHMEYKLKMSPERVLELAVEMVSYAKNLCGDVEFSAEDAFRSDWDFLAKVYSSVIKAGANVINVPDTVGYATPTEMYGLINYLMQHVEGIENTIVSVHCHNDLGMAVANSVGAVAAGARQIECTVNGIGERAGNCALEEVVMALKTRSDFYSVAPRIDTKQIYPASRLVYSITGINPPPNKAVIGSNAFAHESGIHQHGVAQHPSTYEIMTPESVGIPSNAMVLGKHSGKHALQQRLLDLGYTLAAEELEELFNSFKVLADKKKSITDKDLLALMNNRELTIPDAYSLVRFVINSGNTITSTALIKLTLEGAETEQVAIGDGPIDAAFNAINVIAKKDFVLEEYALHSVTEGNDALGEAVVKLSYEGICVNGRGISTDVVEASIKAYINGVNKIMAEWSIKNESANVAKGI